MRTTKFLVHQVGCFLIAVLVLAGCSLTYLEFDKMDGTSFPRNQTIGSTEYSLSSIYDSADMELVVGTDELNIDPLPDAAGRPKECISNEELDSLEVGHRSTPVRVELYRCGDGLLTIVDCKRYHVYGVVVNHYAMYSDGVTCKYGTTGRMWSWEERRAVAIFYRHADIRADDRNYLRVMAHELGHAFNLHHDDGDGDRSLMNISNVVGERFTYEFSDRSLLHLDDHPAECIFPGMGEFYSVTTEHAGWHNDYTEPTCGTD